MPKVSRDTASKIEDYGPLEERREDMEDMTIQFLTTHQDLDATPLMKGLPDDRCSSPHWGYVFKGRLTFDCGDHQEVFEAGEAFYIGPGHVPTGSEPGTEYLQFSPTRELDVVSEVIMRNAQQMQLTRPAPE
jgi:mannose-6-phosphate isomerase-like protein (cupin superfamily)